MNLAYRLAENKGVTVEQLGQMMGADEFIMWAAYDQLSPIGPERFDYLAARIMAIMATLWGKSKHAPAEFMPPWNKQPAKKPGSSNAQILAYFKAIEAEQKKRKARQ